MVQLRFLRLHSITAIQSITFSCHPGHQLGAAERDVKFLTDSRTQSYLGVLKDCVVRIRVAWRRAWKITEQEMKRGNFL